MTNPKLKKVQNQISKINKIVSKLESKGAISIQQKNELKQLTSAFSDKLMMRLEKAMDLEK